MHIIIDATLVFLVKINMTSKLQRFAGLISTKVKFSINLVLIIELFQRFSLLYLPLHPGSNKCIYSQR